MSVNAPLLVILTGSYGVFRDLSTKQFPGEFSLITSFIEKDITIDECVPEPDSLITKREIYEIIQISRESLNAGVQAVILTSGLNSTLYNSILGKENIGTLFAKNLPKTD